MVGGPPRWRWPRTRLRVSLPVRFAISSATHWPTPPSHLLVEQVRQWWRGQRQGFGRSIHEFYNSLGHGLLKPVQWVRTRWSGPTSPPWDVYRRQEWDVSLRAAEGLYDELTRLAQLGR